MSGAEVRVAVATPTRELLADLARVPIAYRVERRFRVERDGGGLDGPRLVVEEVDEPYVKDYDAHRGEGPTRWAQTFDITNWVLLSAFLGSDLVGGAAVAFRTEGLDMLQGRDDLACLWDLRVHPDHRGRGIGTRLFQEAAAWSRSQGCREMVVETQNVNVPACRFYAARGAVLTAVIEHAYPEFPEEVELHFTKSLSAASSAAAPRR